MIIPIQTFFEGGNSVVSYPLVLRSSFLFELSELKTCRVVVRVQGLKRVCNFGPLQRGMLVSVDRLAVPQYQLCKNSGVGDSVRVRGTFPLPARC